MDINDTNRESTTTHDYRPGRLIDMLCRFWEDVNARIWETRTDERAKLLRSFRSHDDRTYSPKFAWLNMAMHAVEVRRRARKDFDLIDQLGESGLATLMRLRDLARERRASGRQSHEVSLVDGEVWDGFDECEAHARAELEQFEQGLNRLLEQAPAVVSALDGALPKALRNDLGRAEEEDIYLLAFELRRAGFQRSEIITLCEFGPNETVRRNNPAEYRHSKYKENSRVAKKLTRMFALADEAMPSQGSGTHGPWSRSSDHLSIRSWSSSVDADTD